MNNGLHSTEILDMLTSAFESWKERELPREALLGYIHGVLDTWHAYKAAASRLAPGETAPNDFLPSVRR